MTDSAPEPNNPHALSREGNGTWVHVAKSADHGSRSVWHARGEHKTHDFPSPLRGFKSHRTDSATRVRVTQWPCDPTRARLPERACPLRGGEKLKEASGTQSRHVSSGRTGGSADNHPLSTDAFLCLGHVPYTVWTLTATFECPSRHARTN